MTHDTPLTYTMPSQGDLQKIPTEVAQAFQARQAPNDPGSFVMPTKDEFRKMPRNLKTLFLGFQMQGELRNAGKRAKAGAARGGSRKRI